MTTSTPPTDPNVLAVLHVLSHRDCSKEDLYNALEELRNMTGQAIVAALEAHKAEISAKIDAQNIKIDAQNAKIDSHRAELSAKIDAHKTELVTKIDALRDQLTRDRRILWTLVALIGAAVVRDLIVG